jgi:hypothetical protein
MWNNVSARAAAALRRCEELSSKERSAEASQSREAVIRPDETLDVPVGNAAHSWARLKAVSETLV